MSFKKLNDIGKDGFDTLIDFVLIVMKPVLYVILWIPIIIISLLMGMLKLIIKK